MSRKNALWIVVLLFLTATIVRLWTPKPTAAEHAAPRRTRPFTLSCRWVDTACFGMKSWGPFRFEMKPGNGVFEWRAWDTCSRLALSDRGWSRKASSSGSISNADAEALLKRLEAAGVWGASSFDAHLPDEGQLFLSLACYGTRQDLEVGSDFPVQYNSSDYTSAPQNILTTIELSVVGKVQRELREQLQSEVAAHN